MHSQVPKKDAATDDALSALGSGVAVFMRAQAVLSVVDKVRSAVDELVHAAMHEQERMARALRAPTGYAFNGTAVKVPVVKFALTSELVLCQEKSREVEDGCVASILD